MSEHRRGQPEQSVAGVPSPDARMRRRFLVKLTIISSLGGLLFGYDTGVISGALLYMKDDLQLTSVTEATVVSVLLFPGAAIVITVLAFNVLGDALRDVLDPRQLHGSDGWRSAPPHGAPAIFDPEPVEHG